VGRIRAVGARSALPRSLVYVGGTIDAVTARKMIPTPGAVEEAGELMMRFAERTGLTSDLPPQRYLWT